MASWLRRTQAGIQSAPVTPVVSNTVPTSATFVPANYSGGKQQDPNAPNAKLDVESKCIYERRLPGNAYITAHVTRLQDGFWDTPSTHGERIENCRFIAVSFCFHPEETINRFRAATISIKLHDDTDQQFTDPSAGHKAQPFVPIKKPKVLSFAPHILYGGVSPETLDWNFNLTGSLGVSQTPVSASLAPSGGVKSSYKIFQMMRIQGSTRSLSGGHHRPYNIDDGEVFWTLEENSLQKSGLPREFTFVLLVTKGDVENVVFEIDVQPKVASWFGHYPKWWCETLKYMPLQKEAMDLDRDLGQRFVPEIPGKGYNFADLAGRFDSYVALPGTTTTASDKAFVGQTVPASIQTPQPSSNQQQQPQSGEAHNTKHRSGHSSRGPPKPHHESDTHHPHHRSHFSDEPVDYHIYLDNPRSINLHASSPAPVPPSDQQEKQPKQHAGILHGHEAEVLYPLKTDPQSLSHTRPQKDQVYKSTTPPLPQEQPHSRPQSEAHAKLLPFETRTPRRPTSNTKLKRRSIDISNMSSPPIPTIPSSSSSQRQSSLRRSRSKSDLRAASSPLAEEPEEDDRVDFLFAQPQGRSRSQSQGQGQGQGHGLNHGQAGKERNFSPRFAADLPSPQPREEQQDRLQQRQKQPLLLQAQADSPRRPRDRNSPSPPRFRRDISPYAELSKKLGASNKRYSMPAYSYVNGLDD